MHGEYYMLKTHAKSAVDCGMNRDNVFVLENGKVLVINENGAKVQSTKVPAKAIMIDGTDIGGVNTAVVEERKILSQTGMVSIIITLDNTGIILVKPTVISKGFLFAKDNEAVFTSIENFVTDFFKEKRDLTLLNDVKNKLKEELQIYIKKICRQTPTIFIIINKTNVIKGE